MIAPMNKFGEGIPLPAAVAAFGGVGSASEAVAAVDSCYSPSAAADSSSAAVGVDSSSFFARSLLTQTRFVKNRIKNHNTLKDRKMNVDKIQKIAPSKTRLFEDH